MIIPSRYSILCLPSLILSSLLVFCSSWRGKAPRSNPPPPPHAVVVLVSALGDDLLTPYNACQGLPQRTSVPTINWLGANCVIPQGRPMERYWPLSQQRKTQWHSQNGSLVLFSFGEFSFIVVWWDCLAVAFWSLQDVAYCCCVTQMFDMSWKSNSSKAIYFL